MQGAVNISVPLFLPKTPHVNYLIQEIEFAEYIDKNGHPVVLIPDAQLPFIRYIAKTNLVNPVKRYAVDLVYKENKAGGKTQMYI